MNHCKAVPHNQNHDLRQLRRVVWSTESNAADRSSKTSAVGSPRDNEIVYIYQSAAKAAIQSYRDFCPLATIS